MSRHERGAFLSGCTTFFVFLWLLEPMIGRGDPVSQSALLVSSVVLCSAFFVCAAILRGKE